MLTGLWQAWGRPNSKLISLLQSHVQKFQAPGMVGSVTVVEFWLLTLCSLPNWYRSVAALLFELTYCISWAYWVHYLIGESKFEWISSAYYFQGCLCAVFIGQPNQNCSQSGGKPFNDTDSPRRSLPGMTNTYIVTQSEILWGRSVLYQMLENLVRV